jgi:hypothetical protein
MKTINLPWTESKDVQYLTSEPNLTRVEGFGQIKTRPTFYKPAQRFDIEIVPPKMPHGMSECLDPTLV